jgi:hypothetical protein
VQEAEQGIEESNAYKEVEILPEEGTVEYDEIQSSRYISEKASKLMVQVT